MTSGAAETTCAAPVPADAGVALAARPAATLPVPYREEIHHPAMAEPLIARGSFDLGPDGTLIRAQSFPSNEITLIGERFITIERPDEGYRNTVPIPRDLAPLLRQLRDVIGDDLSGPADPPEVAFDVDGASWSLAFAQPAKGGLTLFGCGDVLTGLRFPQEGGSWRDITFLVQ